MFAIPNGESARNWVSNVVLKFHNDRTVNESEIIVFRRQVLWAVGKRKGFGEEKRENENEGNKRHLGSGCFVLWGFRSVCFRVLIC